jgi:hypothetical protein
MKLWVPFPKPHHKFIFVLTIQKPEVGRSLDHRNYRKI